MSRLGWAGLSWAASAVGGGGALDAPHAQAPVLELNTCNDCLPDPPCCSSDAATGAACFQRMRERHLLVGEGEAAVPKAATALARALEAGLVDKEVLPWALCHAPNAVWVEGASGKRLACARLKWWPLAL